MPDELGSPSWVEAFAAAGAKLPERPGASATVGFVVTGAKKTEPKSWRWTFADGRVVDARSGPVAEDEVDLWFTMPMAEALAVLAGETGLDVAFMRGRAKLVGSTGTFLSVLPVFRSDEWRALCADLRARTAA